MLRLLIVGQVIGHHLAHVEIVGQLERKHRIINFTQAHFVDIFARAHTVGILIIIGYASAKHNRFQIKRLAQVFAIFIHAPRKPQPPIIGVNEHLYSIKYVTMRIMRVKRFIPRYLCVCVVTFYKIVIDNYCQCTPHYFPIDHSNYLSFGKYFGKLLYLVVSPEHILVGIYTLERLRKLGIIVKSQLPHLHFVDVSFVAVIHKEKD